LEQKIYTKSPLLTNVTIFLANNKTAIIIHGAAIFVNICATNTAKNLGLLFSVFVHIKDGKPTVKKILIKLVASNTHRDCLIKNVKKIGLKKP
jgi:hypothetical protein